MRLENNKCAEFYVLLKISALYSVLFALLARHERAAFLVAFRFILHVRNSTVTRILFHVTRAKRRKRDTVEFDLSGVRCTVLRQRISARQLHKQARIHELMFLYVLN